MPNNNGSGRCIERYRQKANSDHLKFEIKASRGCTAEKLRSLVLSGYTIGEVTAMMRFNKPTGKSTFKVTKIGAEYNYHFEGPTVAIEAVVAEAKGPMSLSA